MTGFDPQLRNNIFHLNGLNIDATVVVMAKLAARLLTIPEGPGSNPVNGNFY